MLFSSWLGSFLIEHLTNSQQLDRNRDLDNILLKVFYLLYEPKGVTETRALSIFQGLASARPVPRSISTTRVADL
jgi:hypothetical protein